MTYLRVLRWHIAQQTKNVLGIIACLVLAPIAMILDDLYDIWDDAKDDTTSVLVCTTIAFLIFFIGWHEVAEGQDAVGLFHMALALVPGAPGLRYLRIAWGEGAKRATRWHYLGKGW